MAKFRALGTLTAALAAWALLPQAPARADATLTIGTVNNGDMVVMQQPLQPVRAAAPRHQAALGGAGGERAAPAPHHRHRHQGRPVRHHDRRQLRGADLGQAGLARADGRPTRRLRRERPAEAGPRRHQLQRQAVRGAVLRRERDAVLPDRPVPEGRASPCRPRRPTSRSPTPPPRSPTRTTRSTASACAASPAGARTWPSSPRWSPRTAASGSTPSGSRSSTRRPGARRSASTTTC